MNRKSYQGLTFRPYIESNQIQARVREIGEQIAKDYEGKYPLFICVLNGAAPFATFSVPLLLMRRFRSYV